MVNGKGLRMHQLRPATTPSAPRRSADNAVAAPAEKMAETSIWMPRQFGARAGLRSFVLIAGAAMAIACTPSATAGPPNNLQAKIVPGTSPRSEDVRQLTHRELSKLSKIGFQLLQYDRVQPVKNDMTFTSGMEVFLSGDRAIIPGVYKIRNDTISITVDNHSSVLILFTDDHGSYWKLYNEYGILAPVIIKSPMSSID
jgi:hypothetical protein